MTLSNLLSLLKPGFVYLFDNDNSPENLIDCFEVGEDTRHGCRIVKEYKQTKDLFYTIVLF